MLFGDISSEWNKMKNRNQQQEKTRAKILLVCRKFSLEKTFLRIDNKTRQHKWQENWHFIIFCSLDFFSEMLENYYYFFLCWQKDDKTLKYSRNLWKYHTTKKSNWFYKLQTICGPKGYHAIGIVLVILFFKEHYDFWN